MVKLSVRNRKINLKIQRTNQPLPFVTKEGIWWRTKNKSSFTVEKRTDFTILYSWRKRKRKMEDSRSSDGGSERRSSVISRRGTNGTLNVIFTDPQILDCYICCEPLSIPVFQVSLKLSSPLKLCLLFIWILLMLCFFSHSFFGFCYFGYCSFACVWLLLLTILKSPFLWAFLIFSFRSLLFRLCISIGSNYRLLWKFWSYDVNSLRQWEKIALPCLYYLE